jgi:Uma2 family endonuclease
MLKLYHQRPKTLALGVRDREGAASRAVLDGVRTIGAAPRHLAWTPARWMLTLVFTRPPFVVIEVLSPEDRIQRMQRRVDDYLNFGVRYVWLVDPATRRGWVYDSNGMHEAKDGVLRTDAEEVVLPLPAIFAAIDAEG